MQHLQSPSDPGPSGRQMRPDLTTLDGQRRAVRGGAYVCLGGAAFCFFGAVAAREELRLVAAAATCLFGGPAVGLITILREMSIRQKWMNAGSAGSPPRQSQSGNLLAQAAAVLGFACGGVFMFLSGSLYPHWRHVSLWANPMKAMIAGGLLVVASLVGMPPAIWKAHLRKA